MAAHFNLFVYGPFYEGKRHDRWLSPHVVTRRPAKLSGSLVRLPVGYPAYIADGADEISGQIIEIQGPNLIEQMLDQFHGISLLRPNSNVFERITRVAVCGAEAVQTSVYALIKARLPKNSQFITGGDWLSAEADLRPLPERMTERQINYIKRLGASSSREIIPVDMNLYRELLQLELIVDKGRRLALTALGREVYRHLNI